MNFRITLLFLLLLCTAFTLQAQVNLQWKFPKKQVVYKFTNYTTFEVDSSNSGDSLKKKNKFFSFDFIKEEIEKKNKNATYIGLTAKNNGGQLLYAASDTTSWEYMSNRILQLDNKGNNMSFYVDDNFESIIELLFRLPEGKVKQGDTWDFDLDFISVQSLIVCDSSVKQNIIKLDSLTINKGDTVAIISYNIYQYFSGNTVFGKSSMSFKYIGKAKFSVTKGILLEYNCIKSLTSAMGNMLKIMGNQATTETYRLELVETYPAYVFNWFDRIDCK